MFTLGQKLVCVVATALPCHSPPSSHLSKHRPPLHDLTLTSGNQFIAFLAALLVPTRCSIPFPIPKPHPPLFGSYRPSCIPSHHPQYRETFISLSNRSRILVRSQFPCRRVADCRIGPRNDGPHFYSCAAIAAVRIPRPRPCHSNQSTTRALNDSVEQEDSRHTQDSLTAPVCIALLPHQGPTSNPSTPATPRLGSPPLVAQHGPHKAPRLFFPRYALLATH